MSKNQEEDEFIAVRVQDPRVQNEGFWNSYVDFKIFLHTNSKAFTAKTSCVRRRYSEFVWLRKKLQKNAGLVPVPELPSKTPFFSFSNEDFIERRRRGLQHFLDKVVHLTVCLSDSQLHLFLQTQLPVGHIEDCVQGHTPYTVTDAILTYASSNRGWAQEEEGVTQEPSPPPVPYESVDSPAPHLPSSSPVENAHKDSVNETTSVKHGSQDADDILVLGGSEADGSEKDVHEINSSKADTHDACAEDASTCVIVAAEVNVQQVEVHETNAPHVNALEHDSIVLTDIEAEPQEEDLRKDNVCGPNAQDTDTHVIMATEPENKEEEAHEASDTCEVDTAEVDAGGEDVHEAEAHKASDQDTEAEDREEEPHDTSPHNANAVEHDSTVLRDSELNVPEEDVTEKHVQETSANKSDSPDTNTHDISGAESDVSEEEAHETSSSKAEMCDQGSIVLKDSEVDPPQENASEGDVPETDAPTPDVQATVTCVLIDGETEAQEEDSQVSAEDLADTKDTDTSVIMAADDDLQKDGANSPVSKNISDSEADALEENTQKANGDMVNPVCANSISLKTSESIIPKLDGCEGDVQTETQLAELHEMDNHTESNGQLENAD